MRRTLVIVSFAAAILAAGCGSGEVSNKDQADKMSALHDAEKESRARDGVQSE